MKTAISTPPNDRNPSGIILPPFHPDCNIVTQPEIERRAYRLRFTGNVAASNELMDALFAVITPPMRSALG